MNNEYWAFEWILTINSPWLIDRLTFSHSCRRWSNFINIRLLLEKTWTEGEKNKQKQKKAPPETQKTNQTKSSQTKTTKKGDGKWPAHWWLCAQGCCSCEQGEGATCSPASPAPPRGVQVPVWLIKAAWIVEGWHTTAQVSCIFPHILKYPYHTNEDLIGISEGKFFILNLSGEVISESLLSKVTKDSRVNNYECS